MALDYLQNGPNFKLYNIAARELSTIILIILKLHFINTLLAEKLEATPEDIRSTVEGLVNLLLESCRCKVIILCLPENYQCSTQESGTSLTEYLFLLRIEFENF